MMVTVAGKPEFVAAWKRARCEVLTMDNILRGWESTGIFPRDRSKPLNSRLTAQADAQTPGKPERAITPSQSTALNENEPKTPTNSREVKELGLRMLVADSASATAAQRRDLWKLQKAFDVLTASNVAHEQLIEHLKATLERQRPREQRRVLPRSQQAFVDMEDILQARDQLRDEADRVRPRRSARQQPNRRSETPEIEDSQDQEIEEVLEEIQVRL